MTVMKTTVDVLKDAIKSYWTKMLFATGLRRNVCCSVNPAKCSGCGKPQRQCATCMQDPLANDCDWLCKKCRSNPHSDAFSAVASTLLSPFK